MVAQLSLTSQRSWNILVSAYQQLAQCIGIVLPSEAVRLSGESLAMGFWDGRAAVDWDFSTTSAESTERQRADIVEATLMTLGLPRPNLTKIMPPSMRIRFRKPTAMLETSLTDAASMDFNISFSGNGLRTAWLQRQYLQQHPAVRVGAVAILQWAKARGLSDSRNGFLTPHAVVILWLHYLVQDGHVVRHIPPETAVPDPHLLSDVRALYSPLEPVDSPHVLGDMIVGFLRYYATTFPWETHVVTINHRNAVPKSDLGFQDSIIAIQDPYEPKKNVASHITILAKQRIRTLFSDGPDGLFKPVALPSTEVANTMLMQAIRELVPKGGISLTELQGKVIPQVYEAWIVVSATTQSLEDFINKFSLANVTKIVTLKTDPPPATNASTTANVNTPTTTMFPGTAGWGGSFFNPMNNPIVNIHSFAQQNPSFNPSNTTVPPASAATSNNPTRGRENSDLPIDTSEVKQDSKSESTGPLPPPLPPPPKLPDHFAHSSGGGSNTGIDVWSAFGPMKVPQLVTDAARSQLPALPLPPLPQHKQNENMKMDPMKLAEWTVTGGNNMSRLSQMSPNALPFTPPSMDATSRMLSVNAPAFRLQSQTNPVVMPPPPPANTPLAPVPYDAAMYALLHAPDTSEEALIAAHSKLTVTNGEHTYEAMQFKCLTGRCLYVPLPEWLFETPFANAANSPDGLFGLFVGQSTYRTTPLVLHYLFQRVCGITIMFVEVMRRQPSAFFYVYVKTDEERAHAIATLHRRVVFDAHGVWVSQNDAEDVSLRDFIVKERPAMYPIIRLPRQRMVVELRNSPN